MTTLNGLCRNAHGEMTTERDGNCGGKAVSCIVHFDLCLFDMHNGQPDLAPEPPTAAFQPCTCADLARCCDELLRNP